MRQAQLGVLGDQEADPRSALHGSCVLRDEHVKNAEILLTQVQSALEVNPFLHELAVEAAGDV